MNENQLADDAAEIRTMQQVDTEDHHNITHVEQRQFRVYKKRWLVMVNVMLINLSISMVWLGFSPVAYKIAVYYGTEIATVNWLSTAFIMVVIPSGMLCTYIMNKYGVRVCLLLASWISFIGAAVRILSTIDSLSKNEKLTFLFLGQILTAASQPFSIYSSPKVSATWFPPQQRVISTTLTGLSNPVGVIFTGLISPAFGSDTDEFNMRSLLITYTALPLLCAIMTTLIITSDEPPTPPSLGGTMTSSENFFQDMKEILFHNKTYVLIMVSVGCGIGLYTSFVTLLEQLLCPWGYSDRIVGVSTSILTASGIIGAIGMGLIVDRTKRHAEVFKVMFIVSGFGTTLFSLVYKFYMGYLIALLLAFLGLFSFGISPIGIETAAEVTFPVGLSISNGLIQLSGQLQSIFMILLLQSIGRPMSHEELTASNTTKCHSSPETYANQTSTKVIITYDLSVSAYITAGIVSFMAIIVLIFLHPTYKRRMEEQAAANQATEMQNEAVKETRMDNEDRSNILRKTGKTPRPEDPNNKATAVVEPSVQKSTEIQNTKDNDAKLVRDNSITDRGGEPLDKTDC